MRPGRWRPGDSNRATRTMAANAKAPGTTNTPLSRRRLGRGFYARSAVEVAPDLIGRVLVHEVRGVRLAGRILETEAYQGLQDRASHASRGRTRRTEPMFWGGGYVYIYLVYGMHLCFNVVVGAEGDPKAVLLRALEPLDGIERMALHAPRTAPADLGRGPGRLARSMGFRISDDRSDLFRAALHIEMGAPPPRGQIAAARRIGVEYAGSWAEKRWRFGWRGHPGLSRTL